MVAWDWVSDPMVWFLGALGLLLGSFLNVCIYRIPRNNFFTATRSFCPSCGAMIPWWLNIPVFGWLAIGGRSRCCGTSISAQYPIVEALTGVLILVAYAKWPFWAPSMMGGGLPVFDSTEFLRFAHGFIFLTLLFLCSVIDIKHMIVPDVISLSMVAFTPVVVWAHPELSWQSALGGVIAGGGVLYVVAWLYWVLRREVGMGMGDVKLLAAIGGWLGWQAVVPTILYGSIMGSVVGIAFILASRDRGLRTAIPFGPFLSIGAALHLMVGQSIQEWVFRMTQ